MKPLISILITVYNRANFIAEAIESVLASTYTDFEVIIVDDCSEDKSVEIAKGFEKLDNRIKVYKNLTNLGDYNNRNKAASYATGEYLKYLDADDLLYPHCLEVMVKALLKYPEAALAISFNKIQINQPYPQMCLPKDTFHHEYLGKSRLGCGPTAAILSRKVFEEIGGFSGKQFIGDHELWYKIAHKYPIISLPPSITFWRIHEGQQTSEELKNPNIRISRYLLRKRVLTDNQFHFSSSELTKATYRLEQHYVRGILADLFKRKISLKIFKHFVYGAGLKYSSLLKGLKKYS